MAPASLAAAASSSPTRACLAARLARSRCSAISSSKRASSSSRPDSAASSAVSSRGNPNVSCSLKTTSPDSRPDALAASVSNTAIPWRRVPENRSSSEVATRSTYARFSTSSG